MRLYEKDAYQTTFLGKVLSCEKDGKRWKVLLDQSCFYPEGGGQPSDTGVIADARVLDVQEQNGEVVHWIDRPLEVGRQVEGKIDWERRFYFMQNHTGEHLVSGIIHKKYGYENVGFHMNEEMVTIDVGGVLTQEQCDEIEREVNEELQKGRKIEIFYPSREELENIAYRSKKEIEGQVRIVRIPECDTCACCGSHVKNTLEIGIIKLLTVQHYKNGVRITMLCGKKAFEDYEKKHKSVMEISRMLSAKTEKIADAVERLKEENQCLKQKVGQLKQLLWEAKAAAILEEQKEIFVYDENLEPGDLRHMLNALIKKRDSVMVLSPGKNSIFHYAAASKTMDSRAISKRFAQQFGAKGGGSGEMVQGTIGAEISDIEREFLDFVRRG